MIGARRHLAGQARPWLGLRLERRLGILTRVIACDFTIGGQQRTQVD
jgi:hypothetical protein